MDEELRAAAKAALDFLTTQTQADLLTCHFYNPRSELFWLFYKGPQERFNFDEISHGPLTHPRQAQRMTSEEGGVAGGHGIFLFPTIPEPLKRNILAGESFVVREGVESSIRLKFEFKQPNSPPWPPDACVYIFLNYREQKSKAQLEEYSRSINDAARQLISRSLAPLLEKPRLDSGLAWKFRSNILRFWQNLTEDLPSFSKTRSKAQSRFREIVRIAHDLIHPTNPNKKEGRWCTLSLLDPEACLKLEASYPEEQSNSLRITEHGIVNYVARTGQTFLIRDIAIYVQKLKDKLSSASRPAYIPCHEGVASELTIPLIVQGHVVGVLNFEADEKDAYDDEKVLLASQIAAATALAIRQETLWRELNVIFQHQAGLVAVTNPSDVFVRTVRTAKDALKWRTQYVWDVDNRQWYDDLKIAPISLEHNEPRENGFTTWIARNGRPVALANVRMNSDEGLKPSFECYIGCLGRDADAETNHEFHHWELIKREQMTELGLPQEVHDDLKKLVKAEPPTRVITEMTELGLPQEVHDDLKKLVKAEPPTRVITDLGFPILSNTPDGKTKVRGVLWVTCPRYFDSVINDEAWCLSMVCEHAASVLSLVESAMFKENHQKVAHQVLAGHFGRETAGRIVGQDYSEILRAKWVDSLIVLSADVRGSTELTTKFANSDAYNRSRFFKFMREYHQGARDLVIKSGGIFDKTIGDGVLGLFLVRSASTAHEALSPILPQHDQTDAATIASDCAFQLITAFHNLVNELQRNTTIPVEGTGLGIGLAMGPALVGSLAEDVATLEFSAYGDSANRAGKMVNLARADHVLGMLIQPDSGADPTMFRKIEYSQGEPKFTHLDAPTISSLAAWLGAKSRSIVLADLSLAQLIIKQFTLIRLPTKFTAAHSTPILLVPTEGIPKEK